jgi:deazaflavin-dependent oxidoreductase (nitroreductase family)
MPGKISNTIIKTIIGSPLHRVLGKSFAVIYVKGTKTSQVYSTPINVNRDDDTLLVVSYRKRTWWRNLREGQSARLHLEGKDIQVCGQVIEERQAVERGLNRYLQQHPSYAKYFGVRLDEGQQPLKEDIERAAAERVLVRLILN